MIKPEYLLIKELTLDGWKIEQLELVVRKALNTAMLQTLRDDLEKFGETSRTWENWCKTFADERNLTRLTDGAELTWEAKCKTPANQAWQLWVKISEKPDGYSFALMMFEYLQAGPRVELVASCFVEKSEPMFTHILNVLEVGQTSGQIVEPVTIKRAQLPTKPAGAKPDPENVKMWQIMLTDGDEKAYEFWCDVRKKKDPNTDDRKNYRNTQDRMERRFGCDLDKVNTYLKEIEYADHS